MSKDLEIIMQLKKEVGVELQLKDLAGSKFNYYVEGYATDSENNVVSLSLLGHKFKDMPKAILSLTKIRKLGLMRNNIEELPSEINKMRSLTDLVLFDNNIKYLPPEICQLSDLKYLHLQANNLSILPRDFLKLKKLEKLYLQDNPLKQPPPEIVDQGIEAIFEYLRQLPEEKIEEKLVNEAKLILVGQGDVGKTCLAKRLKYNKFTQDKTTEGIDILEWKIKAPTKKQEEIKLNVWDFGGQEIYHATPIFSHQKVYLSFSLECSKIP